MGTFPTPGINDTKDIEQIFGWVNNTATGGIFFPIMLLAIWAIIFIGSISEGRGAARAWIWSNLACSILSIILGLLGFLQSTYIYFFIILTGFGLIWQHLSKSTL